MKCCSKWVVLVIAMAVSVLHPVFADAAEHSEAISQLKVRGEATLSVPADQMRLQVGVMTSAVTADAALAQNTKQMKEVNSALLKLGLTADEYKTGQFQIQPQWELQPRQQVSDWQPRIIGYKVTNTLKIKTKKLDLAGKIIEASTKAGANDIGSIFFELADPRRYRDEAIQRATANAKADARSLAQAASVKLVKILSANLDEALARPLTLRVSRYGPSALAEASSPDISPGDVTVRASVTLSFQVQEDIYP